MATTQKITSNLWFNSNAEEAVNFYISVFRNSSIGRKMYYTAEGQEFHKKDPGTVMTIDFVIEGQQFVALNGGDEFAFSEAISFIVNCDNQEEIDHYWNRLTEGGDPDAQVCGWLKDKFGVSWQIVPTMLQDMISHRDEEKARKATRAMLRMKKLDIAKLEEAFNS